LTTSKCSPALRRRPKFLDPLLENRGPADQDRLRKTFVDDDLHCAQHALVLALGVGDRFGSFFAAVKSGFISSPSDRRTA
jgi:hypothetical protein